MRLRPMQAGPPRVRGRCGHGMLAPAAQAQRDAQQTLYVRSLAATCANCHGTQRPHSGGLGRARRSPACRASTWPRSSRPSRTAAGPRPIMHQLAKGLQRRADRAARRATSPPRRSEGAHHATRRSFLPSAAARPAGPGRLRDDRRACPRKAPRGRDRRRLRRRHGRQVRAAAVRLQDRRGADRAATTAFISCPLSNLVLGGSKHAGRHHHALHGTEPPPRRHGGAATWPRASTPQRKRVTLAGGAEHRLRQAGASRPAST